MRFCLALCLTLLCACDKLSDSGSEEGNRGETSPPEGAQKIVTSQQATITVGEQNLAVKFPLAPMPGSQVRPVVRLERPGEPLALQMMLEVVAPMQIVVAHYESEMRAKGLKVQTSMSAKDPNLTFLMGESATASATVLVNRGVGNLPATVSVAWTDKLVVAPGTSSAPADKK
jgi:hypothetical protein